MDVCTHRVASLASLLLVGCPTEVAIESTTAGSTASDTSTSAGSTTGAGTTLPTTTTAAPTTTGESDPGSTTGTGEPVTTDPGTTQTTGTTGEPTTGGETTGGSSTGSSDTSSGGPEPVCGNKIVEAGEECDDGDLSNSDGCLNHCVLATCGDGYLRVAGEACDDGNAIDTDACVACEEAKCGDGHVWAGVEECDDGDVIGNDGCEAGCTLTIVLTVWQIKHDLDAEEPYAATVDAAGDILVASWRYELGSGHVRKYANKDGALLAETALPYAPLAVAATTSGDVLVGGYRMVGQPAVSLAVFERRSAAGEPIWTQEFPGSLAGAVLGLQEDASGAVLVAGRSAEVPGSERLRLGRYTAAGAELWTRTVDKPGSQAEEITADGDGDVIVVGRMPAPQAHDIWIGKYSVAGEPLWVRTFGGPGSDSAFTVTTGPADEILVGGRVTEFGDPRPWVGKYSADGALLWEYTNGGVGLFRGITTDADGDVVYTGGLGGTSVYTYSRDAAGVFQWYETTPGVKAGAYGIGVGFDPNGDVVVAGNGGGSHLVLGKYRPV